MNFDVSIESLCFENTLQNYAVFSIIKKHFL